MPRVLRGMSHASDVLLTTSGRTGAARRPVVRPTPPPVDARASRRRTTYAPSALVRRAG
ncbi:hypothetical protein BSLA_02f2487 [Burkholderia stabilis]|nr:hypothetical protein BSLA_02f2487 [Burkholderia stabilis]